MSLITIYALVSAALLLWIGCAWSGKGLSNIVIKTVFIAASFAGAVVVARALNL